MMKTMSIILLSMVVCVSAVFGGENILENSDFEEPVLANEGFSALMPDHWEYFVSEGGVWKSGLTTKPAFSGKQSLRMSAQGKKQGVGGLLQVVDVKPHKNYTFKVHVINDEDDRMQGTTRGQISIEWLDADAHEVGRSLGPEWSKSLSRTTWKEKKVTAKSPTDAALAKFVVTIFDGYKPGPGGAFFIDDITVKGGH